MLDLKHIDFNGWTDCIQISNDLITLTAAPEIGGRIMMYGLTGESVLWMNRALEGRLFSELEHKGDGTLASWKNYGGAKIWPAPQGWTKDSEWPGPPDHILDSGKFKTRILHQDPHVISIEMTSPPDKQRTGIEVSRIMSMSPCTTLVKMDISFRNVIGEPVSWSIWENVQLTCESAFGHDYSPFIHLTVPKRQDSQFDNGYTVQFGAEDNPQWFIHEDSGLMDVHYKCRVGKIGMDSDAGWLAYSNAEIGTVFCLLYEYESENRDAYPDGGCSVECWTTGDGQAAGVDWSKIPFRNIEAEVLSPMRNIAPGEKSTFTVYWATCKCPLPVSAVSRFGCTSQALRIRTKSSDELTVEGIFGVFYTGTVVLNLTYGHGETTGLIMGQVSPSAPVVINQSIDLTQFTCLNEISLVLKTDLQETFVLSSLTIPAE